MLTAMDEAVGKVLETLRSAHLEENTLIFFFSDNGGPTMRGTTINGSRNDPLRGSKRTTLEGGIRVPFVVQWKGKLPAGSVYEQPVIQLDILPTALAAAGVAVKPEWKLDGVDLVPHLKGESSTAPHDALFWRMGQQRAIRQGDWKLVRYDQTIDKPGGTPKDESGDTAKEKPVETSKTKSAETSKRAGPAVTADRLYNLARDVGEHHDLAGENPEKARNCRGLASVGAAARQAVVGAGESPGTLPSRQPSSSDHVAGRTSCRLATFGEGSLPPPVGRAGVGGREPRNMIGRSPRCWTAPTLTSPTRGEGIIRFAHQ